MTTNSRRRFLEDCLTTGLAAGVTVPTAAWLGLPEIRAADDTPVALRPTVDGNLSLKARRREARGDQVVEIRKTLDWKVSETAIVICDMWADHPCHQAAIRVDTMAPRMNRIVSAARGLGVTVVHAPSSGIKFYEKTPFRHRILSAPPAKSPVQDEEPVRPSPAPPASLPLLGSRLRNRSVRPRRALDQPLARLNPCPRATGRSA